MFSLVDVRIEAASMLEGAPDGASLDSRARALITLAVAASVTSLNPESIEAAIEACLQEGIEPAAMQEIIALVSGLGVHSLMEASRRLAKRVGAADEPLDEARERLRAEKVGSDPYWDQMEMEVPGFLRGLLNLSPAAFAAFFSYCSVPWQTRHVSALVKELSAMACDATPAHRYRAGLRLHIINALKLGAGRISIHEALDIAAAAREHVGIGR